MANKIYAVKKGKEPGIYFNWEDCKKQIDKFSDAQFKSFKVNQIEEANEYINSQDCLLYQEETINNQINTNNQIIDIYVDGSFYDNKYSYAFIVVKNDNIIYKEYDIGTNNEACKLNNIAGELSATMHAINWCKKNNHICNIYHDYIGISKWAISEWKCKNDFSRAYKNYMDKNKNIINKFIHVKGHSGNKYNTVVDCLARTALNI